MEFIFRVFVAALLGGMIGFEREYRAKEAGLRTHFLVAMGSALFMIVSQYGFNAVLGTSITLDPSRVAAQVVSGIGFIGAGTIIFQKHVIKGLTTAAGLWVTSAIGLACGSGLYLLSVASTLLVLLCLETIFFILMRIGSRTISVTISTTDREKIKKVVNQLREDCVTMDSYEMKRHGELFVVSMELKVKRNNYRNRIIEFMDKFDGVDIESIE
ncbi:MgtC/SapB family protein [uncultured Prevotella sp.]|uniref:MgtC/SapB family protein n=1 Tax=uncultured Prevotella sp. TaxID=159272 RepID=UPI00260556F6|nr:MgtC/SapB family protein [uncultured Prevotella sp.]